MFIFFIDENYRAIWSIVPTDADLLDSRSCTRSDYVLTLVFDQCFMVCQNVD